MQKVRLDIPGLDLILGGGLPLVSAEEGLLSSATILLRGGPGSGKSVLAMQMAGCVARGLESDVVYVGVEILPTEVAAQHAAFRRVGEHVVLPPFPKALRREGECRFFAALPAVEYGNERNTLGPDLVRFGELVERCGGRPRVMVVDALGDGYGLGASMPRTRADEFTKYAAENGLVLILLEETVDDRPSPWPSVCHVVMALDMDHEGGRRLTVVKNRFGPSDTGPHRVTIESRGVVVLPRPSCYLANWADEVFFADCPYRGSGASGQAQPPIQDWGIPILDYVGRPPFRRCLTTVRGDDLAEVLHVVGKLGVTSEYKRPLVGFDVLVDFGPIAAEVGPHVERLVVHNPGHGDELLAAVVPILEELRRQGAFVTRVLVGDLRRLRPRPEREEILRSLIVLFELLRRVGLPMVIFESAAHGDAEGFVADVSIEIAKTDEGPRATVRSLAGFPTFQFPVILSYPDAEPDLEGAGS